MVILTIAGVEVVNVSIAQGTTSNGVAADTNAGESDKTWLRKQDIRAHLATGPIMLKISKSIASVTVGSSSPTYKEAEGAGT